MSKAQKRITPRTFFLNEQHELPTEEKKGGGRAAQYEGIDWAAKGQRLNASLRNVREAADGSSDPLRGRRYFVLAAPEPSLTKKSSDKRKAPTGTVDEDTDFSGDHPRVFGRLGLDLIDVAEDGRAVVHATPERIDALLQRTETLEDLGTRDRLRWATICEFDEIPIELRVDGGWLNEIRQAKELVDVVIELQPLLSRIDVEDVMRGLTAALGGEKGSRLTGTGEDYSGRCWFRGKLSYQAVNRIARDFFSVQAIHDPLVSVAAARGGRRTAIAGGPVAPVPDPGSLPVVAVLDTRVPSEHPHLAPYMRGTFVAPRASGGGDHGTYVASRIVYGDLSWDDTQMSPVGDCRFLSADVASGRNTIDEKSVLPTLEAIHANYPDVRVFNLSFSNRQPLGEMDEVKRKERLRLMRDLDNFVFANDVIIVASAGNSAQGFQPAKPYPDHINDEGWRLGAWTAGFNVLVCGAFVSELHPIGLVQEVGWPSPFTRIGPGIANSPVPDFSAPGGNWNSTYNFEPNLGVLAMNPEGLWEDQSGTSLAAPILAREAAKTFQYLRQNFCQSGSHPFAVTVRAFLSLTANRPDDGERIRKLADRTLGYGEASARRLKAPKSDSAVMIWQGEITGSKDLLRLNVPIPQQWLDASSEAQMRLVACSDPPVNDAVFGVWACRKVTARLKPGPEAKAIRPMRTPSHPSYPVLDRTYRLDRLPDGVTVQGDMWLIELMYDELAEYFTPMDFSPSQRVGVALELFDASDTPVSPQPALQALSIVSTMTHLSRVETPVRQPVVVRARVD